MNCSEFKEISEAYLSDELLIETNIQVFSHMENCSSCRADFAMRKALRQKMRSAVLKSDHFAINPSFAARLRGNLRDEALGNSGWLGGILQMRVLVPALSVLLIAGIIGNVVFWSSDPGGESSRAAASVTNFLTEIAHLAAGNHEDCGIQKLDKWESGAYAVTEEGAAIAETVLAAFEGDLPEKTEMLHSHDCIFEGRIFAHVILRNGQKVMSVFFDKSSVEPGPLKERPDLIISEQENGLWVASFYSNRGPVFVVSDLAETQNLNAARALARSLRYRG